MQCLVPVRLFRSLANGDFFYFCFRRRERHAKTIDVAQEEVLTCLGIHLYERLHKIWQKLRAEEQTWQILFHLGIDALRKRFEVCWCRGFVSVSVVCVCGTNVHPFERDRDGIPSFVKLRGRVHLCCFQSGLVKAGLSHTDCGGLRSISLFTVLQEQQGFGCYKLAYIWKHTVRTALLYSCNYVIL